MHELSIVFHAIDQIERIAEEQDLTEVVSVTLEFGEVSGVITREIESCWYWSVKKKSVHLQNAALKIETIPAVTFCEDCKSTYETVKYGKTCPSCGSGNTYLLRGNEINIKEIEAR